MWIIIELHISTVMSTANPETRHHNWEGKEIFILDWPKIIGLFKAAVLVIDPY